MKRIAVIGASGLVGATLVEHLLGRNAAEVVPCIHSSGNAMRLARRTLELRMLDLLDPVAVETALTGCTHVVNCSRGGDDVMITGLGHLLAAASRCGIERFIHLSSVAVYGDPPPPEAALEGGPTRPAPGSYGWIKLEQDRMVMKAVDRGLPALILCPPNISGPYSYFLLNVVQALRAGSFALLDDGTSPCALVDVSNLCHAIELALTCGAADGSRMFVTDDEETDWRSMVDHLLPLVPGVRVARVARGELPTQSIRDTRRPVSLVASLKHLVSSEMREALRRDPLWERVDIAARRAVARLGSRMEDRVRLAIEGPLRVPKVEPPPPFDTPLTRQQLRGVMHSCARAKERLGYRPVHSVTQSMHAFRRWFRAHHGMDTRSWPLLRELYPTGG
jgi:nucleoside-diphosphate-sugar epimerase